MSWYDAIKIFLTGLISTGTAGVIIFGLSNWLGKIWADRFLEREKAKYQKEIEHYKSQLEEIKTNSLRYSGKQFDLYNHLWRVLCDLEDIADNLWEKTNGSNLEQFISNLLNTKKEVKQSRLFLEDEHYEELLDVINKLENYKIGKEELINLSNQIASITQDEILDLLANNSDLRKNYKKIIMEIGDDFKKQLRGNK